MVSIAKCVTCGESELEDIFVNVTLTAHDFCSKCYHSHQETRNLNFCSTRCFIEYMARQDKPELAEAIEHLEQV